MICKRGNFLVLLSSVNEIFQKQRGRWENEGCGKLGKRKVREMREKMRNKQMKMKKKMIKNSFKIFKKSNYC